VTRGGFTSMLMFMLAEGDERAMTGAKAIRTFVVSFVLSFVDKAYDKGQRVAVPPREIWQQSAAG
jgi:hypothetical protein